MEKIIEQIAQLTYAGKNRKEISEITGIPQYKLSKLCKEYGIPALKRKVPIDDFYFDTIDTEEKAYILGFLIADGTIMKIQRTKDFTYRISFSNSIDDKEAIDLIHKEICPESTISINDNSGRKGRVKTTYGLSWTSQHMFETLTSYNIFPRKTYDKDFKLPENIVPEHLWRHFIRGYFDGDGHVDYETINFVFTSKPFMEQIMGWFKNFNYRTYHIQGKTTDYWNVTIGTENRKINRCIYHFLYDDAKCFLSRKKDRFNTEISYHIANRVIEIVEHRIE